MLGSLELLTRSGVLNLLSVFFCPIEIILPASGYLPGSPRRLNKKMIKPGLDLLDYQYGIQYNCSER